MLTLRQVIPPLTARTTAGQTVRAWDYKQKRNLVIAFLHAGCRGYEEFLAKLATRAAELTEGEAAALVVFPQPPPAALSESLPAQMIIASDITGRSQRVFLGSAAFGPAGQERVGVFVADRYGELYAQWAGQTENELPGVEDVLRWLAQIQVACEECGISHWPAES